MTYSQHNLLKYRKGSKAIEIIGEIFIMLIIIFLLIWVIRTKINVVNRSTGDCEAAGGVCIPSDGDCTNRGYHDTERDTSCLKREENSMCCRPWDENDKGYMNALKRDYSRPQALIFKENEKEPLPRGKTITLYPGDELNLRVLAKNIIKDNGNYCWEDVSSGKCMTETDSSGNEKNILFQCKGDVLDENGREVTLDNLKVTSCTDIITKNGKYITFKANNDMINRRYTFEVMLFRKDENYGDSPEDDRASIIIEVKSPVKIFVQDVWSNSLKATVKCVAPGRTCTDIKYGFSKSKTCNTAVGYSHTEGVSKVGDNMWSIQLNKDNEDQEKVLKEAEWIGTSGTSGNGKYLCVSLSGLTTSKDLSTFSSDNPLKIDLTSPTASALFNPGKLYTEFSCSDTASGCDFTQDGYYYLSNMGGFLGALLSGAKDTKWCPEDDKYYYPVSSRLPYAFTDLRVMCYKAKDRAGNAGYDIIITYNLYSSLQTLIKINTAGKCSVGGGVCRSSCANGVTGYPIGCSSGQVCCIG